MRRSSSSHATLSVLPVNDAANRGKSQKRPLRKAILSLGSNLGDRSLYLRAAREQIGDRCTILRETGELDNPAVIIVDQPDFLNQIIEIETDLTPEDLLHFLKGIEERLGRKERERFGPREIDLDILTYEDVTRDTASLTLPHPGLADRAYLHQLMQELARTPVRGSVRG